MGDCNSTPIEGSIRVTVVFKEFSNYVEFGGQATVFDLKVEVTNEFEIPSENLYITYNGQQLPDDGIIEKIVTDLSVPITILDTRTPEQIALQPGKTPQLVSTDVPKIVPKPPEPSQVTIPEPSQIQPTPPPPSQPLQSPMPPSTPKVPVNIPPSTPKGPINLPPSTPKGPNITLSTPRQTGSPPIRPLQTPRTIAPTAAIPKTDVGKPKVKSAPPPSSGLTISQTKLNVSTGEGKKPATKKKAAADKDGLKLNTMQDVVSKIMEKKPVDPNDPNANKPPPKKSAAKKADPNAAPAAGAKGKTKKVDNEDGIEPKGKAKKVDNEDGIEPKGKTKKVVKKVAVTTTTTTAN